MDRLMSELPPGELWKAIILYGLNQASYKMALGKVLLEEAKSGANEIKWEQLSKRTRFIRTTPASYFWQAY